MSWTWYHRHVGYTLNAVGRCGCTDSAMQMEAAIGSGSSFTRFELEQFPGFRLLGKVPQEQVMADLSYRPAHPSISRDNSLQWQDRCAQPCPDLPLTAQLFI